MRIFALSDLHVDQQENMKWLNRLSNHDYTSDLLIIAGDVSADPVKFSTAVQLLNKKFATLCFVPGNHELWVRNHQFYDSLEKFYEVLEWCRLYNVVTEPIQVGTNDRHPVWIIPLFSWYIMPEEGEGSLFLPKPNEDPSLGMWSDNYFVKWAEGETNRSMTNYFLKKNEPLLNRQYNSPVISFSHFLPRQELMFSEEEARSGVVVNDRHPAFNFSRVAGCSELDEQIRRLGARIHVYGHQHRNRRREIDGVIYISYCLGYPFERKNGHLPPLLDTPQLIWQTD